MKPVCLVIGAGAGIGGTVGKRFAREGYHAVLCRRTDADGLNRLVDTIKSDGGDATGYLLNAVQPDRIEERIAVALPCPGEVAGDVERARRNACRAFEPADACLVVSGTDMQQAEEA